MKSTDLRKINKWLYWVNIAVFAGICVWIMFFPNRIMDFIFGN